MVPFHGLIISNLSSVKVCVIIAGGWGGGGGGGCAGDIAAF